MIEEDDGEYYLQWGRPDHVEVAGQVHESLRVNGHQVDNLASCAVMACQITQHQRLERVRIELQGEGEERGLTCSLMVSTVCSTKKGVCVAD